MPDDSAAARIIADAFRLILAREPHAIELRDTLRGFDPSDRGSLAVRLLSSPEFRLLHDAVQEDRETGRDWDAQERALGAIGDDRAFVDAAYELLLDRSADDSGRRHYLSALADGDTRSSILRSLIRSREFAGRYRAVSPQGGTIPVDTQLCELANPAKWDNPEWMALLRDLQVVPDHKLSMHRKSYEFTQLLYAIRRLGRLRADTTVLSVGAGHEPVLYWLANHVARVDATDLYMGIWQSVGAKEGDQQVLRTPEDYAPFPYRRDRLLFSKMDARHLDFADEAFDVAYSLSSIEHVGGLPGAIEAIDEMARVVKRGGLIVVATEYVLSGPAHPETFQPSEVRALFDRPGLRLVQPIDEGVYRRYQVLGRRFVRQPAPDASHGGADEGNGVHDRLRGPRQAVTTGGGKRSGAGARSPERYCPRT